MGLGQGERVRKCVGCAALLLPVVTLGACSDGSDVDAQFGGQTWRSQHFAYRYQAEDAMACEGALESLEAYGRLIAELLGVRAEEWTRTSYYKYPTRESFREAEVCRSTASACADSSAMYAAVPVAGHELVHNVMAKRTGTNISLLLAEGLANALSCDPHWAPRDPEWDSRSFKSRPDEHDVAQAGRLVLGLLRHLSPVELLALIDGTSRDDGPARVRQLLLERHGVDLDDVQREVEADGTNSCVPIYACSGAPLPVGKSRLAHDCRGPTPATLPLEHEALSVHVTEARVRFMPCDIARPASPLAGLWPYYAIGNRYYWLQPPSRPHALWLDNAESSVSAFGTEVDLAPLAGVFAELCELEQAQPLAYSAIVSIVIDGRQPVAHFPLGFSEPARLSVSWQDSSDPDLMRRPAHPVAVSYCRTCVDGAAGDCTELSRLEIEQQTFAVADAGVLVVRPSAPLSRAAVLELDLRPANE